MKVDLQIGDIVSVTRRSSFAGGASSFEEAVVYEVGDGGVQVLPLLSQTFLANQTTSYVMIDADDIVPRRTSPQRFVDLRDVIRLNIQEIHPTGGRLNTKKLDDLLRGLMQRLVIKYYDIVHKPKPDFVPGINYVRYAGRHFDEKELVSLVNSAFDFWLTEGKYAKTFKTELAKFLGMRHCILTNSGSSANLLAFAALTSPKLGDRRLQPGQEVITAACAFPTTVNPIIQYNLVPVFLDVQVGTYNVDVKDVAAAITKKTRAIFLAHTLGNPYRIDQIMELAEKHRLWVIEDNCDGLGSRLDGRYTGTQGHISTISFYPPHHMTMGEGGAILTNDALLKRLIESFRDWGRDCWCDTGVDNTCGKRFDWQLGQLPYGYDHKYTYSHIGYNLKLTDLQAAIGVEQLKKLPDFIKARRHNWQTYYEGLKDLERFFILPSPTEKSEPSWFGFPLTVRDEAPFTKNEIVQFLEDKKIATRMLFAGNLTRQPSLQGVQYRIHENLENTDKIMRDTFWIGVYPGITTEMSDYVVEMFHVFVRNYTSAYRH